MLIVRTSGCEWRQFILRKFLFRLIAILIVLGVIGFIGFAYVGDLSPDRTEERTPVSIDLQ